MGIRSCWSENRLTSSGVSLKKRAPLETCSFQALIIVLTVDTHAIVLPEDARAFLWLGDAVVLKSGGKTFIKGYL